MSENRREFFRVIFDRTISGEVSIYGKNLPIKIDNVSVGGLEFNSPIDIPMHQKVECSFNILEVSFSIDASIVRKATKNTYFAYGVVFDIDQETSSLLFKQLNFYQIRQRKGNNLV
ncbi:PilZ domain-containing protein [Paenisporosarcina indica]|uniref:PilZ domain-containing protein n=1 Tax=Paenisporosarcina indica TaxID=650093 RepID=UPI000950150B|nr:PilZ domain-containing protein [Paenisporosarcina indica]